MIKTTKQAKCRVESSNRPWSHQSHQKTFHLCNNRKFKIHTFFLQKTLMMTTLLSIFEENYGKWKVSQRPVEIWRRKVKSAQSWLREALIKKGKKERWGEVKWPSLKTFQMARAKSCLKHQFSNVGYHRRVRVCWTVTTPSSLTDSHQSSHISCGIVSGILRLLCEPSDFFPLLRSHNVLKRPPEASFSLCWGNHGRKMNSFLCHTTAHGWRKNLSSYRAQGQIMTIHTICGQNMKSCGWLYDHLWTKIPPFHPDVIFPHLLWTWQKAKNGQQSWSNLIIFMKS